MRLLNEIRNYIGNYHIKSGVYHYYRNEFKPAVEFLRKALRGDPEIEEADRSYARTYLTLALKGLAEKHEAKGELAEAVDELRQAAEVSPTYPDLHFKAAQLLERLGRIDEAIEAYRQAIQRNPGYLDARVALAFCLLGARRSEPARVAFEEAMVVRRERFEEPFRRGLRALGEGDLVAALSGFHQTFLALPQLGEEHLLKALEWLRLEDYERALGELDRALELNPRYPDLHNIRGIALCELGRHDDALEAFTKSSALCPDHRVPRLNLAFTYLRAGRLEEATTELEKILQEEPSEPVAAAKLEELRTGRPSDKRRVAPKGGVR